MYRIDWKTQARRSGRECVQSCGITKGLGQENMSKDETIGAQPVDD